MEANTENRIDDTIDNAEYILYGKVKTFRKRIIRREDNQKYVFEHLIEFENTVSLKGQLDADVVIKGSVNKPFSCSCDFTSGEQYLVFAHRIDDGLYLNYCDMVSVGGSEKFAAIVAASEARPHATQSKK